MPDYERGDPDGALAAADTRVDHEYRIARENHNPMEPHATVARWDGERLTLWDKNQWVTNARDEIAAVFGMPGGGRRGDLAVRRRRLRDDPAHVAPRHAGGARGQAGRAAGQAGPLAYARCSPGTGCRPETWQRVALGATRDGRLTSIVHEATAETSSYEQFTESTLNATRFLHASPNVRTRYRLAPLHIHTPNHMRAPGESSGSFALECALDELAYEVGIDPIELRLRNEPERDVERGLPFSSRSTRECYRVAAERFGWAARNPRPRSMRDGHWLIGWGMATATYPTLRAPASARVRLLADGSAVVETAASDMGPGTYTSLTQVASEALALPPERVRVVIGLSRLPTAPVHGGSMTMASVGSAVQAACQEVPCPPARIRPRA